VHIPRTGLAVPAIAWLHVINAGQRTSPATENTTMNIKQIVIEGHEEDIKITKTETGVKATMARFSRRDGWHDKTIAEFKTGETREARFTTAIRLAHQVYGHNATNSMVHDLLNEIERLGTF
jgi:hypothetical protein